MCTPGPAAAGRPAVGRPGQRGLGQHRVDVPAMASKPARRVDAGRRPAPPGPSANSSWVYGQTSSTAACIRRCDSSVPSPSRIVHSAAWSRWYADSLRALAPIAASRSSAQPASAVVERQLVRRQEEQLRHGAPRSRRWAARPAGSCGTPGRRAGTPARPRPGRRPPARPRTSAAAGPRRAGRGRCWPARRPPPSPARGRDHSASRCAAISASSPSAQGERRGGAFTGAPPRPAPRRRSGGGRPCRRPGRRRRPSRPGWTR